jgi:hypothetical protein
MVISRSSVMAVWFSPVPRDHFLLFLYIIEESRLIVVLLVCFDLMGWNGIVRSRWTLRLMLEWTREYWLVKLNWWRWYGVVRVPCSCNALFVSTTLTGCDLLSPPVAGSWKLLLSNYAVDKASLSSLSNCENTTCKLFGAHRWLIFTFLLGSGRGWEKHLILEVVDLWWWRGGTKPRAGPANNQWNLQGGCHFPLCSESTFLGLDCMLATWLSTRHLYLSLHTIVLNRLVLRLQVRKDLVHCWCILLRQKVDESYCCVQYIENHLELLDFLVGW